MSSLFRPLRPSRPSRWPRAAFIPRIFVAVITILFLVGPGASCVGTEVGNPQSEFAEVSLQARGVERVTPSGLTLANGITFSEVWIALEDVEFKGGPDCDIEADADFERPNVVELISGEAFPGYDFTDVTPGEYCQVNVHLATLEEDLPAGAPEELADFAILARGTRPDGRPFELRSSSSRDLVLKGVFELSRGKEPLFLLFALNEWFALDALEDAESDEELLLISSSENSDIFSDFEDRLEPSIFLVRDANDDGILQESELQSPLARGRSDE